MEHAHHHGQPSQTHEDAPRQHADALPGGVLVSHKGFTLEPLRTRFEACVPSTFEFYIRRQGASVVTTFATVHDAQPHLIVVRRDLTLFQHLHPELHTDGRWSVDSTLQQAGFFRVIADFVVGAEALTLGVDITADGELRVREPAEPSQVARTGRYEVAVAHEHLRVGQPAALSFSVHSGDHLVEDLDPYLGAMGHLVALRRGDLAYLHVHPLAQERPGVIAFHTAFPARGSYCLFLQFAHAGEVQTVEFETRVE